VPSALPTSPRSGHKGAVTGKGVKQQSRRLDRAGLMLRLRNDCSALFRSHRRCCFNATRQPSPSSSLRPGTADHIAPRDSFVNGRPIGERQSRRAWRCSQAKREKSRRSAIASTARRASALVDPEPQTATNTNRWIPRVCSGKSWYVRTGWSGAAASIRGSNSNGAVATGTSLGLFTVPTACRAEPVA
jgi:hypothetical protein